MLQLPDTKRENQTHEIQHKRPLHTRLTHVQRKVLLKMFMYLLNEVRLHVLHTYVCGQ